MAELYTLRDNQGRASPELSAYLRDQAEADGIPYAFVAGWVQVENGGKNTTDTSAFADGERGYFQISPEEAAHIGADPKRISSDERYSIDEGLALVDYYAGKVESWGLDRSDDGFWPSVKYAHAVSAIARAVVEGALADGADHTWAALSTWAREHEAELKARFKGHSPTKWVGNVDKVLAAATKYLGESAATVEALPVGKILAVLGLLGAGAVVVVMFFPTGKKAKA